jgi:putative flippase GtrA
VKTLLQQAARYGAASVIALAVDMSILWILVRHVGLSYLLAATLSFLIGAGITYFFSVRFAFKKHRLRDRRMEFASFVGLGTFGLVVNACVIEAGVEAFGLQVLAAKCIAAACSFTCNFLTRRQLLFVRPRESCAEDLSHD